MANDGGGAVAGLGSRCNPSLIIAESFDAKADTGALVAIVTPNSPAEKAGVLEGDIVLRFDGKEIGAMRDLPDIIRNTAVGRTVDIEVWRGGRRVSLKATIGRSIAGKASPAAHEKRRRN